MNTIYNLKIRQGVVVIGVKDQKAQVFKLNREELIYHWHLFQKRLAMYYDKYPTLPQETIGQSEYRRGTGDGL